MLAMQVSPRIGLRERGERSAQIGLAKNSKFVKNLAAMGRRWQGSSAE